MNLSVLEMEIGYFLFIRSIPPTLRQNFNNTASTVKVRFDYILIERKTIFFNIEKTPSYTVINCHVVTDGLFSRLN